MVLFWTGRGILVPVIFLVMAVAALVFTITELSVPLRLSVNQGTNLTIAIAAALSALVTWPFGRLIMRPRAKVLTDPPTGQTHQGEAGDTFLWIDVRYWSGILAAVAVVMCAMTFLF